MITAHQVASYGRPITAPQPPIYEIRVAGRLSSNWDAWFDGLSVTSDADGTSVIRGSVVDQAALHGLLQKLRDVGLVLESLTQVGIADITDHQQPGATS